MSDWRRPLAEIQEGIRQAIEAVRSNKFRSFMTILGVMIGVGAVILINTIMDGFHQYVDGSIDKIGKNVMYIVKWDPDTDFDNLTEEERRRKDITMREAAAISDMCPLVEAVSPEKFSYDNVAKYQNREYRNPDDFRGCFPEQAIVTDRDVSHGRFIDYNDLRRSAMVCVIGPDVADALFAARSDAIGKEITINGRKFTVIGVQEYIDDLFEISENDYIYIPMTTFERLYPDTKQIYLLCSAVSQDQFDAAYDQVVNALRRVRGLKSGEPNNFGIQTQERFRTMIRELTVKVQLAATAVCSVGMLVGVIGVMNIMLIAVTQRTREIGLRKAIGARRKNIIFQFLVEAATLTGFGGLIGIFIGALLGFIITSALEWHYQLSPLWTLLAIISSVGTGLIAGLYPAWKAARLDPIEALRYE